MLTGTKYEAFLLSLTLACHFCLTTMAVAVDEILQWLRIRGEKQEKGRSDVVGFLGNRRTTGQKML